MQRWHQIALILSCVAITACAPTKGADEKGTTVVFANEGAKAFVAGYQPVQITVRNNGRNIRANCELKSSKFSANFTAPKVLNIPAYSQGAVNATLTCATADVTNSATFAPSNLSKKARASSAVGTALLCPICGIGVAIANSSKTKNAKNDIFGFDVMELELQDDPS
jgi:hypothetical protein